ncbi:FAD-dependent monooxygenase [Aquicella lusitana]|uniref:Alkyl hydroperoxide reductase subunit F n=1 Tax=Aquicella lusitana TaxID=254246 RepID=A0A370GI96_9COXI|nr:FAD-dependent monooxygenase [Aquicella lusitana]RDI43371.1 2-polyprenyl-6-methoxyphenol hydroxylase-like FAD-dependent oxidoreductase [Aquicella lusitana]VVC73521.1 Pentachlorophenol 4-monooxygenase [Aquicella lusitana]
MNDLLPVLIVGAGPTGLMAACELARRGIAFRIIDKNTDRVLTSNAAWIQAGTMELLGTLGLAESFLKVGHPCHAINLYIGGEPLTQISFNGINSTYPFILMLPQSETERLLIEYMKTFNQHVEYSTELIDLQQNDDVILATVKLANGTIETIMCQYLLGCDGANSTVRTRCGIFFPGEDLTEQFVVADAQIDSYMAKDEVHVFVDKETVFIASPLSGNQYRIIANLHLTYPRKFFTEREVIEIAQERAHGAYYVKNASWISPFWIHGKIAKIMRKHSIFLLGDAAHTHSPVGGQGMNTGMQDACNLAWKLALVINGKAKSRLLDSYQAERQPIVQEVVNQTEDFTKMILFDKTTLAKLRKFSKAIQQDTTLSQAIATQIAQIHIQYKDSPIIEYGTREHSPKPGERAPNVFISSSEHLFDYFQNPLHNVLLFMGTSVLSESNQKAIRLFQQSLSPYSDLIKLHIIALSALDNVDATIIDRDGIIHKKYAVEKPALFIVRPDQVISYYTDQLDPSSLNVFFENFYAT